MSMSKIDVVNLVRMEPQASRVTKIMFVALAAQLSECWLCFVMRVVKLVRF